MSTTLDWPSQFRYYLNGAEVSAAEYGGHWDALLQRKSEREQMLAAQLAASAADRESALWSKYRLGLDEYEAMLDRGCAICRCELRVARSLQADVDHDHRCDHPGKGIQCCRACVRGVLCHPCNVEVGRVENGWYPPRSAHVARYLDGSMETTVGP